MTKRLAPIAYLLLAVSLPLGASSVRVYVTNSAGDNVHVIDPATRKVVEEFETAEVPHGIAMAPDSSRLYISGEADDVLDVVDRKTLKSIHHVPLSGHPNNVAITRDGKRVYVCIRSGSSLDVIDTASLEKVNIVPVGEGPHNVYLTPDSKYMVAGSITGQSITVIDVKTEKPVWDLKFDAAVRPITFEKGPNGETSRIFLQLSDLHGFVVVDFATHKEVKRVELPPAPPEAFPDIAHTPSHGIGVAPDGKSLWVNSSLNNSIYAYSLPDLKYLGGVKVGASPDWLTFTPDSKQIYISNCGANTVSAVDMKSLKELAVIPVGQVPKRNITAVLP